MLLLGKLYHSLGQRIILKYLTPLKKRLDNISLNYTLAKKQELQYNRVNRIHNTPKASYVQEK